MKNLYRLLCGVLVAVQSFSSFATCTMFPLDFSERFDKSSLIIEGIVTEKFCFEDSDDGHIYTANRLEILSIVKGETKEREILLITQGGIVGDRGERVNPSLFLQEGNAGLFMLVEGRWELEGSENFKAYGGAQGYVYYDLVLKTAHDVFNDFGLVETDFMELIAAQGANVVKRYSDIPWIDQNAKSVPSIDSMAPTDMAAGIRNVLTIYGNGFGSTRGSGYVEFRNASTGPSNVEPEDDEYISWSDTKIEVEVPSRAGSGAIRVIQGGADIQPGLILRFAQLAYGGFGIYPIPTVHLDNNGSGGFTWRMSTDYHSNSDARASFERAIASWRDSTCINWENGQSSTVDRDIQDGINLIRYADTNELNQGVLANTRNYFNNCDANTAYTVEIDMNYNPAIRWNDGSSFPSFNEYDMESISVHELGHAHLLGHVNNNGDFMQATIGTGDVKRSLVPNNIEGGLYVMKRSVVDKPCGPTEMTGAPGCTIPVGIEHSEIELGEFNVFPNPVTDQLTLVLPDHLNGNLKIFDAQGRQVDEIITNGQSSTEWIPDPQLSNGLYIILFATEKGQWETKSLLAR